MKRALVAATLAVILAMPATGLAGTTIEQKLGAATRATVVCGDDPGASFHAIAGRPVVALWRLYCHGIAADLARPPAARIVDASVIQGWLFVGRETAVTRCWQRHRSVDICAVNGQASSYAVADEFVPGAMRRAGVTSQKYINDVTAAVSRFIEATT
jgi:hypothetical protein